ncbi:MAG: GNAT family N-acetyltransferase [Acetobacteraceae bacterium]|nr:GNAT family N-acetyltransferase [Acetobacteraceae bacterium]
MKTPIEVRLATPADAPALAALFFEMQGHYGDPVPQEAALEAARLLCSLPPEGFNPRTLLAVVAGEVVGSCVLNVMMPAARLQRSLYIRDLYVGAANRRKGVGVSLVRAALRLVEEGGFCALDWTADSRNHIAIRMYQASGAQPIDRTYFRMQPRRTLRDAAD